MLRRLLQHRTRRGSVLIFVVALLVLLALIGTAWISTTRNDRYTTQQNAVNTSIELLTQGVVDMTAAQATADLFSTAVPISRPANAVGYRHFDGPDLNVVGLEGDSFLASRYPRIPNVLLAPSATNRPYWPVINAPPTGGRFESPFLPPADPNRSPFWTTNTLAFPSTIDVNGRATPALAIFDGPTRRLFVAGDADGDGIADAGLFRLPINDVPVGQINGFASNQITWYAATRTIDLAGAVNVNTAMFRSADFASDGLFVNGLPLDVGFFASNVGLGELLRTHNPTAPTTGYNGAFASANPELSLVQQYRTNLASGMPAGIQTSTGGASATGGPIDELGAARADFDYFSLGDALHAGLARRLENPGYSLTNFRFQTYPLSTELSLASRFVLRPRGASATRLERDLVDSLVGGLAADNGVRDTTFALVGTAPYTNVLTWYDANFAYDREDATNPSTWLHRRPLLTTFSRTSNLAPFRPITGTLPVATWPTFPADARSPRTSINTATFEEKWRNFWFVMTSPDGNTPYGADPASYVVDDQYVGMRFGTTTTPPPGTDPLPLSTPIAPLNPAAYNVPLSNVPNVPMDPTTEQHPFKMFRSPLRPVPAANPAQGTYILPSQMALLRAAIAAVNADDLIDADANPRRQQVIVQGTLNGTAGSMTVTIYGNESQPVIAEVYVNTKTDDQNLPVTAPGPNAVPYVAIKLYNPTDVPIQMDQVPATTSQGWQIVGMERKTLPPYRFPALGARGTLRIPFWDPVHVERQGTVPPPLPGESGVVIPAQGYLLLENYKDDGSGSTLYRPASSNLPIVGEPTTLNANVRRAYVRDLHLLLDHELILMRLSDPAPTPLVEDPLNLGWAPIDTFDLTGLLPGTPSLATVWHYARPSGFAIDQAGRAFYPGRYRADFSTRRHQGTHAATWDPSSGPGTGIDPWEAAPATPAVSLVSDNFATFPRTFPVQLGSPSFRSAANRFPFGGFMRDLDMLAIPFVAAYRVQDQAGNLIEINPVTMDIAFAEDTDLDTDWIATDTTALREQIGRFAPVFIPTTSTNAPANAINDFAPGLSYAAAGDRWRYAWTKSLLDYFTTQAPHDDFTPNVPQPQVATTPPLTSNPQPVRQRPGTPAGNRSLTTEPLSNFSEDTIPRYGLINLNTANAKVLGMLPWLPAAGDATTGFGPLDVLHYERPSDANPAGYFGAKRAGDPAVPDNEDLGKLIEDWRDGIAVNGGTYRAGFEPRGPFTSIYDLYAIPGFRDAQAAVLLAADPDDRVGDFSPPNPSPTSAIPDGVRFDYEESYLMLNRVSNLVTVRSDAYVLYVLVQGWANAGTATARPVIERRAAFLVDRSGITTLDRKPQLFRIPAD
jgi:hypothetical protein